MYVKQLFQTILLALCLACPAISDEPKTQQTKQSERPSDQRLKIYELYAKDRFAELNKKSAGRLEVLFSNFGESFQIQSFIQQERELYRSFLVAAFENAMKGDVMEAMFVGFVLSFTPPEVVVEAIASELETGQRLEGILDSLHSDVRKHIERQRQQGYPGEPKFWAYAEFLDNHKKEKPPIALLMHMFRTEPAEAFYALMSTEYRMRYPPPRLSKSPDVNRQIRPLFYAEHQISDVIWHDRHSFDIDASRLSNARKALQQLSAHENWWVRLYVAGVLQNHHTLRDDDILRKLQNDENDLVKQLATDATKRNEK
jgi:hypothetical protein